MCTVLTPPLGPVAGPRHRLLSVGTQHVGTSDPGTSSTGLEGELPVMPLQCPHPALRLFLHPVRSPAKTETGDWPGEAISRTRAAVPMMASILLESRVWRGHREEPQQKDSALYNPVTLTET